MGLFGGRCFGNRRVQDGKPLKSRRPPRLMIPPLDSVKALPEPKRKNFIRNTEETRQLKKHARSTFPVGNSLPESVRGCFCLKHAKESGRNDLRPTGQSETANYSRLSGDRPNHQKLQLRLIFDVCSFTPQMNMKSSYFSLIKHPLRPPGRQAPCSRRPLEECVRPAKGSRRRRPSKGARLTRKHER